MSVKYVVSIAGELLYFDEERKPAAPLAAGGENQGDKPELKLIAPGIAPAAAAQWNEALSGYTPEQRHAAEISEVQ